MTADQIIEVLQAWKAGKRLEYKFSDGGIVWFDGDGEYPTDFNKYVWRVKPEQRKPREWWLVIHDNGNGSASKTVVQAEREIASMLVRYPESAFKLVRVREVMDNEDERPTETEDNRKVWLKNDLVERDYASLSVLPNYDPSEDGGFGYFYYASDLRKHPELRKYVIGG